MMDKEFLEHVGILGMHWGRKKGRKAKTSTVKVVKTNASEDHRLQAATRLEYLLSFH